MSEHVFLGDRVEGALASLHEVERTVQEHIYVSRRQSSKLTRGGRNVVVANPEYIAAFGEAVQTFTEAASDEDFSFEQTVAGIIRFRAYDPGIQALTLPSTPIKTITPDSLRQRMKRIEMLREGGTPFIFKKRGIGKIIGVTVDGSTIGLPQVDITQNGLPNAGIAFNAKTIGFLGLGEAMFKTSVLDIFSNCTVGTDAIEEHWKQRRNSHNPRSLATEHILTLGRLQAEAEIFSLLGVKLDTTPITDIARKDGFDTEFVEFIPV